MGRGIYFATIHPSTCSHIFSLPVATACEVLARRIVHNMGPDRLNSIMSTRYRYVQLDGTVSNLSSALEFAIDDHWQVFNAEQFTGVLIVPYSSIFLSSSESQLGKQ